MGDVVIHSHDEMAEVREREGDDPMGDVVIHSHDEMAETICRSIQSEAHARHLLHQFNILDVYDVVYLLPA
ncbi:unnamed protein product [Ranitomeya imitator]|uniref:Uncharacterized protein n=1 Tax=Ranitomeya imitator TaxID=111125 RepID=A0ABN9MM52_9NEOB|nr:unnamed protein product [Ranitomeya imitator]